MTKIILNKKNEVWYHVTCNQGVCQELSEFFSFFAEGYQWSPKFKNRMWDGKIRLFNIRTRLLHVGLRSYIEKFCKDRNYEIEFTVPEDQNRITHKDIEDFAKTLDLRSGGKSIQPRDYQIDAVVQALKDKRRLLISPTASGKSLIIYIIIRYLEDVGLLKKSILVVPTVSLVKQMIGDFEDYSSANGWNVQEKCHGIHAGIEKNSDKPVIVSTWQSVYKLPKSYFSQFKCAFMDEAHTVKAKSLTSIMESMTECEYRIGTTGTLDDSQVNRLVLIGLMGDVYQVTTTAKLIKDGTISDFTVHAVQLEYPEADRKLNSKNDYVAQINFLIEHEKRMKFIQNLITNLEKRNTLLLFGKIAHGKAMYEAIREILKNSKRQVFYIDGGTDPVERERIRKLMETLDGAVLVASYGTLSTGTNIKKLHVLIFGSPNKGKIRNLQSIGRTLRKSPDGISAMLIDIIDDFSHKAKDCFPVQHAKIRFQTYLNEKFKIKTSKVKL